jgi:polar amino acid transport system substrate-binding protein
MHGHDGKSDPALELARSGTLRAAINFGNTVLARREADGSAGGITADIAREVARRLGVPVSFVHYEQAGDVFDGLATSAWDVCFLAIEPVRAAKISFTEPYILIEGAYLVPPSSSLQAAPEVDRVGTRVGVIVGSAYDLYLTRQLKHATLTRQPSRGAVMDLLANGNVDVVAGVKPQVQADAHRVPGSRLLPQAFMSIRQAMGTPRERAAGAAYLADLMRELKQSGFMREAFARNRIEGASLAP